MTERALRGGAPALAAIGAAAVAADVLVFRAMHPSAERYGGAHLAGFLAAFAVAIVLAALLRRRVAPHAVPRWGTLVLVALLIAFLRGGLLASLLDVFHASLGAAQAIASIASVAALLAALRRPGGDRDAAPAVRWDAFCIAAIACAVLLRLFYLGVPELIFEEAYYWNYAQHFDYGYLDHPLMVAWMIRAGVALLGNTELAVRSGAFLCWVGTGYFAWRLARELFGREAALGALMLAAVLPAYFFFGFFMSPDAPQTACWAASVYFAHRALAKGEARAWLALGAALGLGMISKYTIALLAIAVVLFVLLDRRSRGWLARREPYLGALIALVLFSPVIAWNWQHDWISFFFQSRGRIESGFSFSLHRFLGNILGLVTPTGIASIVGLGLAAWRMRADRAIDDTARASARLLGWLALVPLAVFAAASLFRVSKLNWTGPVWLPLLPYLALVAMPAPGAAGPRLLELCRRAWPPTIVACLLIYGAMLHWLGPGLPGARYPRDLHLIGWRDFGGDVERLVERLRRETGRDILVVGMDRNRIASGLAFYRTRYRERAGIANAAAPAFDTASESLFDEVGLMYELWFPAEREEGRTLLLVAKDASTLEDRDVLAHARPAGAVIEIPVRKAGRDAGRYFARLFEDYHADRRGEAR